MVEQNLEVERKYAVDSSTELPPAEVLTELPEVVGVESPQAWTLHAIYYDTASLALAGQGITLRRRTGGEDPEWTLKLPSGDGTKQELTVPLGVADEPVPPELLTPVRVHTRREPVAPALEVHTIRRVHRLIGKNHAVLAEVSDDAVTTRPRVKGVRRKHWREWEVELGDDAAPQLLDALEERLCQCGATPADTASKLAHALGDRVPQRQEPPAPTPSGPAADLLLAVLREQLGRLKEDDGRLRRGQPDSVHQLRIAARRLRAGLASFKDLVEPAAGRHVRDELRWLGGELALARDAQVMRARLERDVEELPPELVRGPVRERIRDELNGWQAEGCSQAMQTLESGRYFQLLDLLDELVADPPWAEAATSRADTAVEKALKRERKRVRRSTKQVKRAGTVADTDVALHELRKATKRLRYAAQAAQPVSGKPIRRYARAVKKVQDRLGEHQDGVVARRTVIRLSEQAARHGEDGFTYGVLHSHERDRATSASVLRRKARGLL
ncbi:CYTH and CHAD domain-containing protein [Oryzihumus sp.]